MKIELNKYYVVTKSNGKGIFLQGDRLHISKTVFSKGHHDEHIKFLCLLPPREDQKSFFGLSPMNSTKYFESKEELLKALEGVELEYNTKLVNEIVQGYQAKIDKLKIGHNL